MPKATLIKLYLIALLNMLLLSGIGVCLAKILNSNTESIEWLFIFYMASTTLTYAAYASVFIILLHEYKFNLITKAVVTSVISVLIMAFFMSMAGESLRSLLFVKPQLIMLILGFVLPYSQRKMRLFFIGQF